MAATPEISSIEDREAGASVRRSSRHRSVGGSLPCGDGSRVRCCNRGARLSAFAARFASVIVVAVAGLWLVISAGSRRLDSGLFLHPVVERLMLGQFYDPQILSAMDADLSVLLTDPVCDYQALQDITVVRAALVEAAFQVDDPEVADRRLTRTEQAARAALACSPGSATAWTILAWVEHLRREDTPLLRTYLDLSYRYGPFEGWALVRRMEMLLALYPALDAQELARLRQAVDWIISGQMSEFLGEQYVTAKPAQRKALRDILAEAPEREQKKVAEFVRNSGEEIDLPLVEPLGSRPWK